MTRLTRPERTPSLVMLTHGAALNLMVLVWAADYLAGRDLTLWVLYLVPIGLIAFVLGTTSGLVYSVLALALLCVNGLLLGNPYASIGALVLERVSDCIAYIVLAVLVSALRGSLGAEGPPTSDIE